MSLAEQTRYCARPRRILPKRSSTADADAGGSHRRVQGSFWGRVDLLGVADHPINLLRSPIPSTESGAFRILSELLGPSGLLAITLRLGGDAAENAARGFHDTSAEELIGYANRRTTQPDLRRPNLTWETLVFAMPYDGTGSLPLLRHAIVNDNKSSTYKLGLLRTLVRLAETAPGLVIERTDDYVDIPFGAVGLYWLKQYLPLESLPTMQLPWQFQPTAQQHRAALCDCPLQLASAPESSYRYSPRHRHRTSGVTPRRQ